MRYREKHTVSTSVAAIAATTVKSIFACGERDMHVLGSCDDALATHARTAI